MSAEAFTDDRLLGGRVALRQPARGFRAGSDAVFLAAAVGAAPNDHIVDLGCGHGAAALCLAARLTGVRITGLEREAGLAALARDNAAVNGWSARLAVVCADLGAAPFAAGGFDHAMTNPPYRGQGTRSPDRRRADARHETTLSLADWVVAAARLVRRGGTLTTVFTAARLAELTTALAPFAGDLTILPLWSRSTGPAEIVLVRAVRGGAERVIHLRPLVVHRDDGRFSAAAEGVLRGGQGLSLAEAMARP